MIGPSIDVYLDPSSEAATGPQADRAVPGAVREYLVAVRAYLREIHEEGASGRDVNEAHSDLIDRLLRRLFELSEELFFDGGGEQAPEFCVVAVGGYARREMSIHSDVDVLFLYDDKVTPYVTAVTERLQRWLWDAQVMVGGATRTISETIQLARQDPTVCTGVLAPRFLVGSGVLFHRFNETLNRRLLAKPERFISGQIESVRGRHADFGETLYLLQPNVKESAGGLRDYHASYWAMQASQSSARGKNDFLHLGLLTEAEAKDYFEALDFLWRVRNELHLRAGRKHDQLSFDQQEHVATAFGYADGNPATSDLPVERLMRDYYLHARSVMKLSSLVMEQCLARVRRAPLLRRVQKVEKGLRVVQGQLEIPHRRLIRDDPSLLLDVFAVAAQRDVPLTRKARRIVRENLHRIDDAFRESPQAADSFLRILRSEHRVSRSLIAMNEVGLLARYLPEWDHIVCRWQHVMYHTYTVDVHSIFLVEELRRLRKGDYAKELPDLTERMRGVDDPTVMYLGCLLHDVGKGLGGNHSEKGAALARQCLERLGLEKELVDRVVFLVAQHLHMSHLAQRRDLSDPKLIFDFARLVGDRENLRNLYLLTVADMRASSRSAWTDWKGRLLRDLFEKTAELLETGADGPDRAIELVERRVETRRTAATEELCRQGVPESAIEDYFETMPRRYLTAHSPSQIARHARVVLDFEPDQLMATAVRERRGGFSELILCTRDVHGLYSNVAGVLTAHHIDILGAHVYTSSSGLALEIYRITTPAGGEGERAIAWKEFQTSLTRVLRGEISVDELILRRGRPVGVQEALATAKPESVSVTNEESDFYTIVDVAAADRLGLLHDLTRVIADNGLEVYISKAGRVLDQVTDAFYLKDAEGSKVYDAALIEKLQRELLVAARAGADRAGE